MPVKNWEIRYSGGFQCHLIVADNDVVVPMRFANAKTAGLWAATFRNSPASYIPILFDVNVKAVNVPFTPDNEAEYCVKDFWGIYHNRWMLYIPKFFMHPVVIRMENRFRFNVWPTFSEAMKIGKQLPDKEAEILNRQRVKVRV